MSLLLKTYPVSDLSPGMVIGEPILTRSRKIILEENKILTDPLIRLLVLWDVKKIKIKESSPKIKFVDFFAEHTEFAKTHGEIVSAMENAFNKIRYLKEVPLDELILLASRCLNSLVSATDVIRHLLTIQQTDDYTFRHSVNVRVICGVIGKWLGIQSDEIHNLVLAGMLHDIGKTQIPLNILNKPGSLSKQEMDIMKSHAEKGFQLLSARPSLSENVLHGILQHHERIDGSGYPFALCRDEINPIAKIIAIADIHDAMTSNRVYRNAVTPFSVLAELSSAMFSKLAPDICSVFLNNLSDSLLGCNVRLSDNSLAKVVYLNRTNLEKPLVQSSDGQYINLAERHDLYILAVLPA